MRRFQNKPRFNSDDRPKRSFGDKPSGSYGAKSGGFKKDFKPRGEGGGFGDKPRFNSDDRPKRSFGDKPSGSYGAKSGGFKKEYKPRGEGSGFGDKPRFNTDDRPKRSFEDKPKRTFGDKSSGFKKDFDKTDGFEKKPRTGYLKKPDGPFGVQPSFFKKSESEDAPKTTRFSSQDSEKRGLGRKSFRKDSNSDEVNDAPKSRFSNSDESKPRFTENNMGKKPKLYSKKKEEFFSKNEVETVHKHKEREPKPLQEDGIRLNRFIANSGVCSRREADVLIQDGMIKINGKVVDTLGYIVKDGDTVKYGSKILNREKMVYVLLNKPKDFITSTTDPQERETVMQLVKNACKERIYPVGRLDRATTGLLLLTNDGELTEKLTHPSHNIKKIYQLELDRPISVDDANAILEGLYFEEGKAVVDSMAVLDSERKTVGIEIHIGWNRIVRRMFEAKGYDVVKLDRVLYAGLTKKDLPRGHWKHLTEKEVVMLKHFN
ncbi:MAG: rRNA pseudouridine synthase [Bacteroidetes bacterium]|nr:MAG: rRNA pseudouridine synthase [Bacteroidota bacterium]